jgi:hypothetical protein
VTLIVFLTRFFANLAVSWMIVFYVTDGTVEKA